MPPEDQKRWHRYYRIGYTAKKPSDLTADEKQTISSIAGLAGAAGGDSASAVSGSHAAQNTVDNNAVVKIIITAGKVAYKVVKNVAKNGRIHFSDLKDIVKKEGFDILDNITTLTDDEINLDDAKAIIDLVISCRYFIK